MPSLTSKTCEKGYRVNTMAVTPQWLCEQLLNNSGLLVLDCRPYNEFAQSHVHGAINLAVPSLMLRRLKKGAPVNFSNMVNSEEGKRKFAKRDLMDKIVLYDSSADNLTNTPLELIVQRLVSEGLNNVRYLKGRSRSWILVLTLLWSFR